LAKKFSGSMAFLEQQEPTHLFFCEADSSVPLFELLSAIPANEMPSSVNHTALMNAIYHYHPEYAAMHNMSEQTGQNDGLGCFLNSLGFEAERRASMDRFIRMHPQSGTEFISFYRDSFSRISRANVREIATTRERKSHAAGVFDWTRKRPVWGLGGGACQWQAVTARPSRQARPPTRASGYRKRYPDALLVYVTCHNIIYADKDHQGARRKSVLIDIRRLFPPTGPI